MVGDPLSKADLVRAGLAGISSLLMNSEPVQWSPNYGSEFPWYLQVSSTLSGGDYRGCVYRGTGVGGGDILEFCPPLSVTQFSQL